MKQITLTVDEYEAARIEVYLKVKADEYAACAKEEKSITGKQSFEKESAYLLKLSSRFHIE